MAILKPQHVPLSVLSSHLGGAWVVGAAVDLLVDAAVVEGAGVVLAPEYIQERNLFFSYGQTSQSAIYQPCWELGTEPWYVY